MWCKLSLGALTHISYWYTLVSGSLQNAFIFSTVCKAKGIRPVRAALICAAREALENHPCYLFFHCFFSFSHGIFYNWPLPDREKDVYFEKTYDCAIVCVEYFFCCMLSNFYLGYLEYDTETKILIYVQTAAVLLSKYEVKSYLKHNADT